jgi:predicted RNA binding protein YcfA (HicA-like mRNA interferase family)
MGRPLKIKKISEASYNSSTGANPGKDIGFNALASLTNPVPPSNVSDWISGTDYLGVVGGSNTVDTASYPTVQCRVFITGFAEEDGYIIRQKGSHKYLVGGTTSRTALVAGSAYRITTVGTFNWNLYGASGNPQVGDIFTCTTSVGSTGDGAVNAVGQCVLTSDLSPTAGNMSISYFSDGSSEIAISKLTNKFLQNFAGGATGGNADTGDVWAATDTVDNVVYAANFFSDEGTTAKSGAEVDTWGTNGSEQLTTGALDLAIVQNYNS